MLFLGKILIVTLIATGYCSNEQCPTILNNSTRSVVVTEGQSVRLECFADGFPKPHIYWRRENNAAFRDGSRNSSGNILEIPRVEKEDRGTYFCVAENGIGRRAKFNAQVEVKFSPVVTVPRPRIGQARGYDVDLACHVEAYPLPAILWFHNGKQLSPQIKYRMSSFTLSDALTDVVLRFRISEPEDYGKYICEAANEMGKITNEVELFETADPVCPPACNVKPLPEILRILSTTTSVPEAQHESSNGSH